MVSEYAVDASSWPRAEPAFKVILFYTSKKFEAYVSCDHVQLTTYSEEFANVAVA